MAKVAPYGVATAFFGFVLAAVWPLPEVQATAIWGNRHEFRAVHAVDGDISTEWLLPDGAGGFIDISLRGQTVSEVKVVSARNAPHWDRGAAAVRVQAFAKAGRLIKSVDLNLMRPEKGGGHPTGLASLHVRDVEMLRVVVDTFHGAGGGLAEVIVSRF